MFVVFIPTNVLVKNTEIIKLFCMCKLKVMKRNSMGLEMGDTLLYDFMHCMTAVSLEMLDDLFLYSLNMIKFRATTTPARMSLESLKSRQRLQDALGKMTKPTSLPVFIP